MQKVQNLREKLRRKLSIHDKNPDFDDHDEFDDETQAKLEKEIEEAEASDQPMGKPGSFLNRLIMHGNKKTDEQLAAEGFRNNQANVAAASASSK